MRDIPEWAWEMANKTLSEDGEECPYGDLIERVARALIRAYEMGLKEERKEWEAYDGKS